MRAAEAARIYPLRSVTSIAFPAISTGVFDYPMDASASIMLKTAIDFARDKPAPVKRIVFCLFDVRAYRIFSETLAAQTGNLGTSPNAHP